MTRLGWLLLTLFAAIVAGFALVVREARVEADRAPPVAGAGTAPAALAIPVAGVAAAALEDNYGQARDEGARMHGALDIPAPRGTIVVAAAPGRVEKLFDSAAGGHTIYVRSDDDSRVYYYAHLDRVLPATREGVRVARGQEIATVGSTGNADPAAPHLHFEVKAMAPGERWYQGRGVDPYPLLTGR